jgi:antitoxin (DNA-binding transcriptional repressor) of toxin-antitoxin stability system
MTQINLYEAKTHLSRLVDEAANGRAFVIAKDGKPMAKLGPLGDEASRQPRQIGQMSAHAKRVNWIQWWRDWKAADRTIDADFESSAARPFPGRRGRRRGRP